VHAERVAAPLPATARARNDAARSAFAHGEWKSPRHIRGKARKQ
jgi:hypothetical protein